MDRDMLSLEHGFKQLSLSTQSNPEGPCYLETNHPSLMQPGNSFLFPQFPWLE